MTKELRPNWPKVQEMIRQAVAAGTHSSRVYAVCQAPGCGAECDGCYHVETDGRRICKACWQKSQPKATPPLVQMVGGAR